MNSYEISYSKYNNNVFPRQYGYYLNVIFEYSENKYLVTKIANQIILKLKIRDCCDLQNKNSEFYSEVLKAINKLNDTSGGKQYNFK